MSQGAKDPVHRPKELRKGIPRLEHYVHLVYFALVAISGPYHFAAGVCCILGIVVLFVAKEG